MLRGNDLRVLAQTLSDHLGVESAVLVFLSHGDDSSADALVIDSSGSHGDLERIELNTVVGALTSLESSRFLDSREIEALEACLSGADIRSAIVHVLRASRQPLGLLIAIDPDEERLDAKPGSFHTLDSLGATLSTILENRGLSNEVSELTARVEALDRLVESKDRLIASVSHELRTPLTSVIGMSTLARDIASDSVATEVIEMLNLVVEQGTEMSNIIDDLLAHASASADGLAIHSERFDLVREVGIIATTHGLDAPSTQGGLWVVADRLRVRQIVRNLITNAKRYGGEHVWLAYGIRSDRVSISVVDDGPGVSAGAEEAVFEPYQSDHSSIGWPGSLGLGLSLSRSMAQLMSGNVTYARRDAETWFTLELPAVAGLTNQTADAESARVHDLELERALRQA